VVRKMVHKQNGEG